MIFKILLLVFLTLLVILFRIIIFYGSDLRAFGFKHIPLNNLSNSRAFKEKIDQIVVEKPLDSCSFLVAGSSMSLNNIDCKLIHEKTGLAIFNVATWACKIDQINKMLPILKVDNLKYLLVGFNNSDYGPPTFQIDYGSTRQYLHGNNLLRVFIFLSKLNINTFFSDWDNKKNHTEKSNEYASLKYDRFGSVLYDRSNFVIDSGRWKNYGDTSGFRYFYKSLLTLDNICKQRNVKLIVAYLPARKDLLNPNIINMNKTAAAEVKKAFGVRFYNLQNVMINSADYCDGEHLFAEGATQVTGAILDSIYSNKIISK